MFKWLDVTDCLIFFFSLFWLVWEDKGRAAVILGLA